MEFKHSTAPWQIDEVVQCSIHSGDKFIALINDSSSFSRGEHKANAHLIAAAPELLSELIRLRNIVASYKQDSGDNLDITDAVIAKALGQ
ncbi:hypothetical protein [Providencia sp. PROV024]|uniref:hypothetical protein n=1 Tax=Providencia sp. PROV024 TaxID=2949758 RepID=UPI00234AF58C|nr:hypothetical protein [Providencia sp. PROV024]WOC04901.1 hypothetical protein P3L56_03680 [Providencia sp. PROV024]